MNDVQQTPVDDDPVDAGGRPVGWLTAVVAGLEMVFLASFVAALYLHLRADSFSSVEEIEAAGVVGWLPALTWISPHELLVATIAVCLTSYPGLVLHEFGHWWTARRLGATVFSVRLGQGPRLFRTRWGTTAVDVRLLPLSGENRIGPASAQHQIMIHGAGPRTHLLLAAVLVVVGVMAPTPLGVVAVAGAVVQVVWWINNSLAEHGNRDRLSNDGTRVRELRQGGTDPWALVAAAAERGDVAAVELHLSRHATGLRPEEAWWPHQMRGSALAGAGRYDEAVEAYAAARATVPDMVAATVEHGWADALLSASLLASRDVSVIELSQLQHAVEVVPDSPAVQHTTALLDLALGRPDTAADRLRRLLDADALQIRERQIVLATLAVALARLGRTTLAERFLRDVPPECPFFPLARETVALAGDGEGTRSQ